MESSTLSSSELPLQLSLLSVQSISVHCTLTHRRSWTTPGYHGYTTEMATADSAEYLLLYAINSITAVLTPSVSCDCGRPRLHGGMSGNWRSTALPTQERSARMSA